MLTLLFDGVAYGMLLFILAVGLSVTMGLMGFANLAHGVFAMIGGYAVVTLMAKLGAPFGVALTHVLTLPGLSRLVLLAAAENLVIGTTLATSAAMVTGMFRQSGGFYAALQVAGLA